MQARKVLVLLSFILLIFAVWAKVDYAIHGYMGYFPPEAVVLYHWFWQWTAGVPLTAGALAAAFWAGAPKSKLNRKVAVGIFLTVILLSVGQLEDFFYFTLNSVPFPTHEWTWFRDMWFYRIFGTWTTEIHFTWLALWTTLTAAMWLLILKHRQKSKINKKEFIPWLASKFLVISRPLLRVRILSEWSDFKGKYYPYDHKTRSLKLESEWEILEKS